MRDWARKLPVALGVCLALSLVTAAAGLSAAALSAGPQLRLVSSAGPAVGVAAGTRLGVLQERFAAPDAGQAGSAGSAAAAVTGQAAGSSALSRLARDSAPATGPAPSGTEPTVASLRKLLPPDLLVVGPARLPGRIAARIRRLQGVVAAEPVDAARIKVNGTYVAMLGVDPSAFRGFAAPRTARSSGLWRNVAGGGIAVSYTMGKQDNLPPGRTVRVLGTRLERLRVGAFGTVGIAGVDAVVSDQVARSLGMPADNAIVISAPHAMLAVLAAQVEKLLPRRATVAPLVTQQASAGAPVGAGAVGAGTGAAGAPAAVSDAGPGLSQAEIARFLAAAQSRTGMPYVWGAAGPRAFDCSGLVQWSLAQAGVVMPRVAGAQALTGPQVPVSELRPADLLFYYTDPTAPRYISHVAIYVGNGMMLQAPEPGMDVQVVPADLDSEFAGAVRIYPRLAAEVAASPVG
ncbi:MAG TPA: C40 family peptidase [Streptosporangiaceae bacterium]|nr:C40 family peptidase [Streptosporangiaceae bacterium]